MSEYDIPPDDSIETSRHQDQVRKRMTDTKPEVKRYGFFPANGSVIKEIELPNGRWVRASDYDSLLSKVQELEQQLEAARRERDGAYELLEQVNAVIDYACGCTCGSNEMKSEALKAKEAIRALKQTPQAGKEE